MTERIVVVGRNGKHEGEILMMIKEIRHNGKILNAEFLNNVEIRPASFVEDYATKEELKEQVASLTRETRVLWECVKTLSSKVDK